MYNMSNILLLVMLVVLLIIVIMLTVNTVYKIIAFEKESNEEWCYLFEYVIDVKIKRKKFMDFVVLTIIKDVLGLDVDDTFNILDKNGRRCLMMCSQIGKEDKDVLSMVANNAKLSDSRCIKSVVLHHESDGDKEKQFLIRVFG